MLDIDVVACRARQQKLLDVMHQHQVDLVVVTMIEHVQYLAGPRFGWMFHPSAALAADGRMTLVAPERQMPEVHAADEVVGYAAQWHSTLRNDQRQESTQVLQDLLDLSDVRRLGYEFSCFPSYFAWEGLRFDIEPYLWKLRRRKDPDELARIRMAIRGTERMYQKAREMIRPGLNEIELFNELQSAAVREFREPLTGTGNDYQCGARGGPPRDRLTQAGELYILDLGPAYRGYFADNARTVAVTSPTDIQYEAFQYCEQVLHHVQQVVRPGKSARELFQEAQEILDASPIGIFNHHLGHGIGLFPHESPHLNPNWDDTFEVGDVFTAEPGLYDPQLQAGIRIEDGFVVTESGVEKLSHSPLELKIK